MSTHPFGPPMPHLVKPAPKRADCGLPSTPVETALAIGANSEGAVHSHARRALEEGLDRDMLRHVALLAIPTLGFPAAMRALSWIDDVCAPTPTR